MLGAWMASDLPIIRDTDPVSALTISLAPGAASSVFDDSVLVARFGPHEEATLPVRVTARVEGRVPRGGLTTIEGAVRHAFDERRIALLRSRVGYLTPLPGPHTWLDLRLSGTTVFAELRLVCPPAHSMAASAGMVGYEQLVSSRGALHEGRALQPFVAELLTDAARRRCPDPAALHLPDLTTRITTRTNTLELTLGDPMDIHAALAPRLIGPGPASDSSFLLPIYTIQDTTVAALTAFGLEARRRGTTELEIRQRTYTAGVPGSGTAVATVRIVVEE